MHPHPTIAKLQEALERGQPMIIVHGDNTPADSLYYCGLHRPPSPYLLEAVCTWVAHRDLFEEIRVYNGEHSEEKPAWPKLQVRPDPDHGTLGHQPQAWWLKLPPAADDQIPASAVSPSPNGFAIDLGESNLGRAIAAPGGMGAGLTSLSRRLKRLLDDLDTLAASEKRSLVIIEAESYLKRKTNEGEEFESRQFETRFQHRMTTPSSVTVLWMFHSGVRADSFVTGRSYVVPDPEFSPRTIGETIPKVHDRKAPLLKAENCALLEMPTIGAEFPHRKFFPKLNAQSPMQQIAALRMEVPRKRGDAFAQLSTMPGMDAIRDEVHRLMKRLEGQARLKAEGRPVKEELKGHLVIVGAPGTGKTTIAKLIGEIYRDINRLSIGHTVETHGEGLVGTHVGEAQDNVTKIVDSAIGGVLFIDEAYAMHPQPPGQSMKDPYKEQALNTLMKLVDDRSADLVCILAGYPGRMHDLIHKTNEGMPRRFPKEISISTYNADALYAIFEFHRKRAKIDASPAVLGCVRELIQKAYAAGLTQDKNGGWVVDGLLNKMSESREMRAADSDVIDPDFIMEDVPPLHQL